MKFIRFLLFPFSIIYDLITRIRNFGYDNGLIASTFFDIPIINVGNLSVGGTGKTPQVEYLIRLLQDSYKVAILSRGYKRKTRGYLVVDDSKTPREVGDEPYQYFSKFPKISVAVCENRVVGIRHILKQFRPDVILLDDAYQHRKIRPSFSLLLTKYDDLFINDFLLPAGNLRESKNGAKRADAIVVTKCEERMTSSKMNLISSKLSTFKKPVFFTKIEYQPKLTGSYCIDVRELKHYEVLLITGIAAPSSLLHFLKQNQITFRHMEFPDHYNFSSKDIEMINRSFSKIKSDKKLILTTEKDYVRLQDKIEDLSFISIQSSFFSDNDKQSFDSMILRHLES